MKIGIFSNKVGNPMLVSELYKHCYFLGSCDVLNIFKKPLDFEKYPLWTDKKLKQYEIYSQNASKYESWQEFYDDIDVSDLKDYDLFYIMLPYCNQYTDNKVNNRGHFSDISHKIGLHFISIGKELAPLIILSKASELYKIPMKQFNYEVGCLDILQFGMKPFEYERFHGYEYNDLKLCTSLPYFYTHEPVDEFFVSDAPEKDIDLTFHCYCFENAPTARQQALKNLSILQNKFKNTDIVLLKDKTKAISRDSYYKKIEQSRYTYIVPSFISTVFSIDRFQDSIYKNCLPIIADEANVLDISKTFDYDFEKLKLKNFNYDESFRQNELENIKKAFKSHSSLPVGPFSV